MNFSLVLNSRKRPEVLEGFLNSVKNTTNNIQDIEVIVNIDNDDIETILILGELYSKFSFFKFVIGNRPDNLNRMLNITAKESSGNYVWILNDDAYIVKQDWDIIILQEIANIGYDINKIFLVAVGDNSADKIGDYTSFPILSRTAIISSKMAVYDDFVGLGADVATYNLYNSINRILKIQDNFIDHIYHNTKQNVMNPDNTAKEMRENTAANFIDCSTFDISEKQKILLEAIKNGC